ncbi:hypothetical protein D9758_014873 [Tetrapyrgos nigripes]|uniref:Heterokaryon incompatibility domain-containing protein n=1 Tax=Tetrapyrgos nigripes TaxID=182062 RepID=A0A8H5FT03_9AGAR|nr:hypothetical protein D9758_014873 [Tetrapyrgos nigripes]
MRLLRTSTPDPVLQYFSSYPPPYAILSHTWGDDEVLFQDVMNDFRRDAKKSRGGPGWQKLEASRRFALDRGFEYIWNDTCCIDKESSAELTESLNSMFKYYEDSSLCVAFISDVSSSMAEETARKEEFKQSRWFSRGWTLQELIAPADIVFVDRSWVEIGLKSDPDMEDLIREATGISSEALENPFSPKISVAAKMSWAASRETTREEDMAYCLIGLFRVNMPPMYGEGSYNAFLRLQLEVIKLYKDRSIFAWKSYRDNLTHRGLLANSPREFLGRGSVQFIEGQKIGRSVQRSASQEMDPHAQRGNNALTACICCLLGGLPYVLCYACFCLTDSQNDAMKAQATGFLQVDPTFTMTNANLHINFPFEVRQFSNSAGDSMGRVSLNCYSDERLEKYLCIYVRAVGNGQFQRIRADLLPEVSSKIQDTGMTVVREMQFQQPSLDGYTSRFWRTSARRCVFVVADSLTAITGLASYKFMRHVEWHPKHASHHVLTNPVWLQASQTVSPSWCLPFYDAVNGRGFIFSVMVDAHARGIYCDAFVANSITTETDMLYAVKSYWQQCIFHTQQYVQRRSHGDRAFLWHGNRIIRMHVRNVTTSSQWKDDITDGTAIFAIDVATIRDPTLREMLKRPDSETDPSAAECSHLVFLVELDSDCQLSLDEQTRHRGFGDTHTLVRVSKEDLPTLMLVHGSFGQVEVKVGLDHDENISFDLETAPDGFIISDNIGGKRSSLISGRWVSIDDTGRSLEHEIVVKMGKTTRPYQFGSHCVSIHVSHCI